MLFDCTCLIRDIVHEGRHRQSSERDACLRDEIILRVRRRRMPGLIREVSTAAQPGDVDDPLDAMRFHGLCPRSREVDERGFRALVTRTYRDQPKNRLFPDQEWALTALPARTITMRVAAYPAALRSKEAASVKASSRGVGLNSCSTILVLNTRERRNRIEFRRVARRQITEDNADQRRADERGDDRRRGIDHGEIAAEGGEKRAEAEAAEHAQRTADDADEHRLDQELA